MEPLGGQGNEVEWWEQSMTMGLMGEMIDWMGE